MTQALLPQTPVAVIGAGAMGAGIAQVAASAGHTVWLLDTRAGAAASAIDGIHAQFEKMAAKGKMTLEAAQAAGARLLAAEQLADLANAGLVVEAIVENLAVKQQLFKDLEAVVSGGCILASNTSSISITAIGAALGKPQRLAGLHFFNPAPLMALVEVVSGLATDQSVANTLFATAAAWGKTPVHAKSTPGFIVNRVARPYYAEALRVLTEGGADCATLDACCREAGGFRMGPFELMDMIGHDVNFAVTNSVWRAFFNDPRFLPSLVQQDLVDAGFLGKKSGRGFYNCQAGADKPLPATEPKQAVPTDIVVYGQSVAAQALVKRLQANSVSHSTAPATTNTLANPTGNQQPPAMGDILATVGGATLRITDGRTATRCAAETTTPNTVLVDLALDYAKATRLAVSVSAQCDPAAANAAIGLLQAAGFAVSQLQDIPGLIVMRTVAMLANEAADAVNQGVCDAPAVDTAMRLGVNYPCGPLAWANVIGLSQVSTVLANLAHTYGEDRYRTSPLIQHHVFANKAFS
jgi:3-hydroxybutyryl-CoA dehydrogenase